MRKSVHVPYGTEIYTSGELGTDLVRTHRECDSHHCSMPLHSHAFLEIAYVLSGPAMDYGIGTDIYRVCPGDILLIPPDMLHGPVLPAEFREETVRDVLWVSNHFISRMAQLRPNAWFYANRDYHVFRTAGTRWSELGILFEKGVAEQLERHFGWEAVLAGNTMILLSQLGRAMLDTSVLVLKQDRPELLLRVLEYMENHLSDKLTLESVAEQFQVSKSTLTQLFRKKLDVSFYAYLTKRRLSIAKALIIRGMPLEQVGKQVGFKEHSAFYRAFKQEFGLSPREYKNVHSREEQELQSAKDTAKI